MLAGEAYSLVPHLPFRADRCLVQRDFDGASLFQHRTNGKWSYSAEERLTENFQLFEECTAALAELRRRWNGRVFHAPDRPPGARLLEADLAGHSFGLEIIGRETVELQFMPFGELGAGRNPRRQNWWCEEQDGHQELVISDGSRVSYRFATLEDGIWMGHQLLPVPVEACLRPANEGQPGQQTSRPGVADMFLDAIGYPAETTQMWERYAPAIERLALRDAGVRQRLGYLAEQSAAGSELRALVARLDEQSRRERLGLLEPFRTNYRSLIGGSDEHD
jgi:hypothetical protein